MSPSRPWYEEFFDGLYGKVLADDSYEMRAAEEAGLVRRLLALRKGQRVLDIPCGMGRLTIRLAAWGAVMTGVDLTASYVRRARRRARRAGLEIRFLQADMREIAFEAEFDAAFNWFSSFGYFSDRDNLACARRILRALKPGGRFLIEGINRSWLMAHLRAHSDTTVAGVRVVQRHRWHPKTGRMDCDWMFSKGRKTERHRSSMRVYNGAEIRKVLRAAGFGDIQLCGRPPLGRLTRHSRRLLAVARRPRK